MDTTRTHAPDSRSADLPLASPGGAGRAGDGHLVDIARLERLRRLARLLDTRWRIPGTRIPVGLDGIASLVPVVGDTATAVVSVYIVTEAARFGLPASLIARMAANVGVDWLFGSVPVLGTIFDIAFKANRRNLALLHGHLEERLAQPR